MSAVPCGCNTTSTDYSICGAYHSLAFGEQRKLELLTIMTVDKRYFIIDQQIARHFVDYS